MEFLDRSVSGVDVIANMADLKNLSRSLVTAFCFALALNCNLPSGRMDLSAGSQMYLACIFGGNLALSYNLGGGGVLVFSIIIGAISGLAVGLVFIKLRILPMVLGIGMTLVYECISFAAYRQQGLMLFGKSGVGILSNIVFIVLVLVIIIAVITYLFQYSKFGYERRAIQGNQKISSDSGINIFINCVICYTLAGALVAVAGVFDTAFKGSMVPVLGMSSNGSVFSNMFPMFIGIWLSKFSNPVVGILTSCLSVKILTTGLSKLNLDGSLQTCILFTIFLLFMIYRMNEDKIQYTKNRRTRKALAVKTRKELAFQNMNLSLSASMAK
jgi:ribose/xylose/arabinose/galactoside ABC-type transport system permease subunit